MTLYRTMCLFLLIVQIVSCTNYEGRNSKEIVKDNSDDKSDSIFYLEKLKNEYLLYLNFFEKDLVNHFPENRGSHMSQSANFKFYDLSYRPPSNYFFQIVTSFNPTNIVVDSLIEVSKARILASDTTSLLIFSYTGSREFGDNMIIMGKTRDKSVSIAKENVNKEDKIPIPHFSDYPGKNTFSCLDSSYIIYVLDYNVGVYTDITYLEKNVYFPKEWKHGFSKGIAISKKEDTIIYWVTVW